MAKNKKSIWSLIILIATIVSLVLLIAGVVILALGVPAAKDAAYNAAIEGGSNAEEANLIVGIAIGTIIGIFIASSIFDVLKIIGGFMFSLKGRWGIFCIVVAILGLGGSIGSLIADFVNKAGAASIAINAVSVAVGALLVVACFKHKAENAW